MHRSHPNLLTHLLTVGTVLLATSTPTLVAQDLQQIIERAGQTQQSLGNLVLQTKLTIKPPTGVPRDVHMEMRLRRDDEQIRSWIGVLEPASLKGMQFVQVRTSPTDDQLSMYVPATKQVQQVPPTAREKKFLNSDFSLADLQIQPTDLSQAKIVEETAAHWVVAAKPKGQSMYEWVLFTIDKQDYAVLRVTFYQTGHKMIKDLHARTFTTINQTRLATRMEMKDLTSGSISTLEVTSFATHVPADELPQHHFTSDYMRSSK